MTRLPNLGPRGEGWLAAQLALIVAVGYAAGVDPWRLALPSGLASALGFAGATLSTLGVAVAARAALELLGRRSFSALPMPASGGKLVVSGLYSYVRHPVYS